MEYKTSLLKEKGSQTCIHTFKENLNQDHNFYFKLLYFSDSKNSTPEPESEDSQPKEFDEEKEQPLVLEPPSATTTSTLGKCLSFERAAADVTTSVRFVDFAGVNSTLLGGYI